MAVWMDWPGITSIVLACAGTATAMVARTAAANATASIRDVRSMRIPWFRSGRIEPRGRSAERSNQKPLGLGQDLHRDRRGDLRVQTNVHLVAPRAPYGLVEVDGAAIDLLAGLPRDLLRQLLRGDTAEELALLACAMGDSDRRAGEPLGQRLRLDAGLGRATVVRSL